MHLGKSFLKKYWLLISVYIIWQSRPFWGQFAWIRKEEEDFIRLINTFFLNNSLNTQNSIQIGVQTAAKNSSFSPTRESSIKKSYVSTHNYRLCSLFLGLPLRFQSLEETLSILFASSWCDEALSGCLQRWRQHTFIETDWSATDWTTILFWFLFERLKTIVFEARETVGMATFSNGRDDHNFKINRT